MKLIHYSRLGYNGDYTYTSVCGKAVKTHQDNEASTIHPEEANCKVCLKTKEYKTDWTDTYNTSSTIKRRIYIESDILQAAEFRDAQRSVISFAKKNKLKCVDRVFSQVLDYAWHDLDKTWKAVKDADEVYATSSLMPLVGNSYMGAPVIFNGMCERAISEKVIGKSVFILNYLKHIDWDMIDIKIMKEAFKKNDLYMYDDEWNLTKVDILKIKK
jgi:hypothetical protein